MMKLLSGSHPLPAWLKGHQGHQGKISPVPTTIFCGRCQWVKMGPYYPLHAITLTIWIICFWCHCRCSNGIFFSKHETNHSEVFSEPNKSLAIVGHMLYSVDVCTLCRLCSISTPWEVRAPEQECLQPQDCTNSQAFLGVLVVGLTLATKSAWNSGPPGHLVDSP